MIEAEYLRWTKNATEDKDLTEELKNMTDEQKEDSFYRNLEFGTGGLRGVIGAGTNRMNIYTVAKASQGIANYLNKYFKEPSIAVSYDSRIKSDLFAKTACEVFAANGIKVYIYSQLMPTPCLSFAVRNLKCSAGIMITASHNPAKYNGYKVYNDAGCQITNVAADEILAEIEKLDIFADIKKTDFDIALKNGDVEYISEDVYKEFTEQVKNQSVLFGDEIDRNVSIVYTPLNGTGLKPVLRALKESGFNNITVVKEQENPDGNFPTCTYPNPEIKEALNLGIQYAKKTNAELLLATDPDCDRVGIAVKENDDYKLITGNEVGLLLLDYICSQRIKHNKMPKNPIAVKTIVTTDLAEKIAENYGVEIKNVLTGFKFIGEQIGLLEQKGEEDRYIFGFEESYGYLSGSYVRDKDAVNASFLICEMFAFYKTNGVTLIQKLNEIYQKYGYLKNSLYSYEFPGSTGFNKMQQLMQDLRDGKVSFENTEKVLDYNTGIDGLPKSNVLKFIFKNGNSFVIRPSGTEPKIKIYLSVSEKNYEDATKLAKEFFEQVKLALFT